ncbi:MAG: peptidase S10 [Thermoanaerobaculia bacterium]|nr:peptidase S10 [Thermoanaerobaculia bacterium]
MQRTIRTAVLLAGLVLGSQSLLATDETPADEVPAKPTPEELKEQRSTTRGVVTIGGEPIPYSATVGDLILRDEERNPVAKMVYVEYLRDDVESRVDRPVTFAFNGGPGSASVWVHLGAFGPKKVLLDDEGWPTGPPPGRLVNNEYSLLDATDLVFIDPVETGWSRPLPAPEGEEAASFTGYSDDVAHVAEFIRLWLARNDRLSSPKFIAGESYGTTRAAGLAEFLQGRHGIFLNGINLISSVLNWQTKVFNVGNDLPHVLILPTMTATAWFHGKLPGRFESLEGALREAEDFALTEYGPALLLGERLPDERRQALASRLAELTGLSTDYVEATHLRPEIFRYAKEVLRDRELTVGRLDSRYTGRDLDAAGERFEFDPFFPVASGWYVALLKDYLRRELGYSSDDVFRQSAGGRIRPWNYHEKDRTQGYNTNAYANYAETLRSAMHVNPYLKVLVMSGYYDLATPYFATDYTVEHMQLAPELRDNIWVEYYESGHMMYVRRADHAKFRRDFLKLIDEATTPGPMPGR